MKNVEGFVVMLAIIAFAIGIGCIFGAGVGWLSFAGVLVLLLSVSA